MSVLAREVCGRRYLYPVEASPLGLLPHDGTVLDGAFLDHAPVDPSRTLILASCDPAVALLSAAPAHTAGIRLLVLPRSSRAAIDLMAQGLVHAAGVHLAASDQSRGNEAALNEHPSVRQDQRYRLLRLADWEEGIATAPRLKLNTVAAAVGARLRWVGREPGSGAQQCFDELMRQHRSRDPARRLHRALGHRGVAEAIRAGWADAGICLRLTSDEANLEFLEVRRESYDICFPDSLAHDPRIESLVDVVRSTSYRRMLGELPGYDSTHTGESSRIRCGPP